MIFQGGIGGVIAKPTGGNQGSPSAPQRFFTIQSAELDFTQKLVEAMGQNQGPDDVFASDRKYTGKCGALQISPDIFNALMFGDAVIGGTLQVISQESHTLTGTLGGGVTTASLVASHGGAGYAVGDTGFINGGNGQAAYLVLTVSAGAVVTFSVTAQGAGYSVAAIATTYTGGSQPGVGGGFEVDITAVSSGSAPSAITVNQSTAFTGDQGVQYAVNPSGQDAAANLTAVATAPAVGQYTVASGVYTFTAGDAGQTVLISYSVNNTAQGRTLTVYNHVQGYGPYFEMWLPMNYQGQNSLHIRRARASSMGFKLKRDGYLESPFDFTCYPDGSGAFFDFSVQNPG